MTGILLKKPSGLVRIFHKESFTNPNGSNRSLHKDFFCLSIIIIILICLTVEPVLGDNLCLYSPTNCSCTVSDIDYYSITCAGKGFTDFPSISECLAAKVISLDLGNNYIANLPENSLSNFDSLKSLNLQINCLSTLPYKIFDELQSLQELKLSRNKWVCNSDLIWFRDWLVYQQKNANISIDYDDIICTKPEELKYEPLISVNFAENLMSCVLVNDQSHMVLYHTWESGIEFNSDCAKLCVNEGYTYAALYEWNNCICGNISDYFSVEDDCKDACTNATIVCEMKLVEGAISVYDITLNVSEYHNINEPVHINVVTYIETSEKCIWETGDGQVFDGPLSIQHKYSLPGTYTIRVTLNINGQNKTAIAGIQVLPVSTYLTCLPAEISGNTSTKLIFTAAPEVVLIGQNVDFSVCLKGIVGELVTVTWDFGDNSAPETNNITLRSSEEIEFTKNHSFYTKDIFIINVTVSYDTCYVSAFHSVQSLNESFIFKDILVPICTKVNESVQFHALISTNEITQFEIDWIFGDGNQVKTSNTSISHIYSMPGPFTAQVFIRRHGAFQNQSKLICIQEPLTSVQLHNNGPTILGLNTVFTLHFLSGSNYEFYWNNNESTQTFAPVDSFNYTFLHPGNFTMDVVISNYFSTVEISSNVLIIEMLDGLQVQHNCYQNLLEIFCKVGSNGFSVVVQHGIPSCFQWTSNFTLPSNTKNVTFNFTSTGTYCIHVNVSNAVSSLSKHFCIKAQVAILNLTLHSNSTTMATNEVARFEAVHNLASNVQYIWRFSEEACCEVSGPLVFFSNNVSGIYYVSLQAYNSVSIQIANITIIVTGLEIQSDLESMNSAKVNKVYKFHCKSVVEPSRIEWTFQHSYLSFEHKKGRNVSYTFKNTGNYNVQLSAWFTDGKLSKNISVKSLEEIKNLHLFVDVATSPVLPTHKMINFSTTVDTGNDIEYIWAFTDYHVFFVNTSYYLFSYQNTGFYWITVTASNHPAFPSEMVYLCVELLDAVSHVEVLVDNSTSAFVQLNKTVLISAMIDKGSDISYMWTLGNNIHTESFFEYTFTKVGNYVIEVVVNNEVSKVNESKTIKVLERPTKLQWFSNNWTIPVNTEAVLEAFLKSGTDIAFHWTIVNKDGLDIYNFTEVSASHRTHLSINITLPGNYTVMLTASNDLGKLHLVEVLSVREPVSGLRIVNCCSEVVPVNTSQLYQATVDRGTNVAYMWHFAVNTPYQMTAYGDAANYTHPVSGIFLVKVEARNGFSSAIASEYLKAVDKIIGIELITDSQDVLVNVSFTLNVLVSGGIGSDIKYYWNLDDGLGDFNSSSTHNITYTRPGIYTVNVVCQNEISSLSASINISVISCKLPELKELSSTPDVVFRSQNLLLEYNIEEVLCPLFWTVYNWTVYKTKSCAVLPLKPVDLPTAVETSLPSLVISMNTLDYGSYCFQLTVSYVGISIVNTARSLVSVIATPLVAVIDGGNLRLASSTELLVLDGSRSIDPDLVGDQTEGLNYQWGCTSKTEGSVPNPRCIQGTSTEDKISAKLDPTKVYIFTLNVTKGNRQSITNQTVEVVSGTIPVVKISCLSCQSSDFISTSQRLELIGRCPNCDDLSSIFKWTAVRNDGSDVILNDITTTTGDSSNTLVIRAGTLLDTSSYIFRLTVDGGGFDNTGFAEVTYKTNTPPVGGNCSVTPLESIAMETLVTISCQNWFDPDSPETPLLYIMQIMNLGESNGGIESTLLYHGSRERYETYLPLGGNEGEDALNLLVKIQGNHGAEIEAMSISMVVKKPELEESTTVVDWMHTYSLPHLMFLQQANDPQRMLDYATTMASVLNEEHLVTDEIKERVILRGDIISAVASSPCIEVNDLSHISTALAIATAIPDEIVQENTYTTILGSMNTLLSILAATTEDGFNVDDVTGNALLMVISNTLSALNQDGTQLDTSAEYKRAAINELLSDTEWLLDSLMAAQLVHEQRLRLTSETIVMSAKRTYPKEISTTLKESGSYFKVPGTLFINLPSDVEIIEEFFLYNENPYIWQVVSTTTKVSQLEYKFVNGTRIPVNNLDKNEMIIFGLPHINVEAAQEIKSSHELNPGEKTYITLTYNEDVNAYSCFLEVVLTTSSWHSSDGFISLLVGLEAEPNLQTSLSSVNLSFSGNSVDTFTNYTFLIKPVSSTPVMSHHITAINHYDFVANISVSMFQQSCQYFDVSLERWSEAGCQAHEDSTRLVATCSCDHMTTFGAGSKVLPSDIKFRDIKNLDIRSNPIALIACCTILFFYIVAMGTACYYDRLDLKFISVMPVCGKNGAYCYEIYIQTGERIGAGTSAHIGISIYGSNGKTGARHLISKTAFKRNMRAAFRIYSECNLEDVQKIRVWHDNTGLDPSWYLATVLVVDIQTGRRFHFVCETWLSLLEDKGAVEKTFQVLGKEELKKFSTIFQFESKRQLANQHLWLSVIDRPQQSRFTRKQRVTCCLVLIYTYMCVNAIWYGLLSKSGEGSYVIIALATGLIVFPFNLLVAIAFIRTKYKIQPSAYSNMPRSAETVEVDALCRTSQNSDSLFSAGSFASHTTTEPDSGALDLKHSNDIEMKNIKAHTMFQKDDAVKPQDGATLRPLKEQGQWWSTESILGWPEKLPPYNKSENIELMKLPLTTDKLESTLPNVVVDKPTLPGVVVNEPTFSDKVEDVNKPKKELSRKKSTRKGIKTLQRSSRMLRTHSLDDLTASDDEFWQSLLEEEGVSKQTAQSAKEYLQQKRKNASPKESGINLLAPKSQASFCPRQAASLVSNKTRFVSSDEGIGHGITDSSFSAPEDRQSVEPSLQDDSQSAASSLPGDKMKRQSCMCTSSSTYLLPSWFVYINYTVCFLVVALCGVVILLYGSKFGEEVAVKWIITLFVSLTLSMLLLEPVKVILFAFYSASVYESLDSCYSNDSIIVDKPIYEYQDHVNSARMIKPPQGFGLLQAKEEARKLGVMYGMLRHLWVFLTLFGLVMLIGYTSLNPAGIDTVSVMKDIYINAAFDQDSKTYNSIQTYEDFWIWLVEVFARQSHASEFKDIDYYGNLLGVARLRQIRSIKEQCQVQESSKYKHYFDELCYGTGTSYSEDRGVFVTNNMNWTYRSNEQLNGMSMRGQVSGPYSGGGFVEDLGSTYNETLNILYNLIQNKWLDVQTRAVFVEVTFYNANLNLYSVLVLLIEFPLSSGAFSSSVIVSSTVNRHYQATGLLVSEIFFGLILIYFTYIKICDLMHYGVKQFLTSIWSILSIVMVMLGYSVICLIIVQAVYSSQALNAYVDNPMVFVSFYAAAYYSEVLLYCYGILIYAGTIKLLQIFQLSSWLVHLLTILSNCFWFLMGSAVIFIMLILVFSFLGNQLFGTVISDFRSVGSSVLYLYSYITGAPHKTLIPIIDTFPIFGPLFMSSFFFICLVLVACLFSAIIINTYRYFRRAKLNTFDFQDHVMVEFMIERLKKRFGIIKPKEFRHRVKFAGVDSISTRSLSSGGTFSQSNASQVSSSGSGSGISFIIPSEKIDPDYMLTLLKGLTPMVDDLLEKLESLKLLELEEEHVGNELLCRKNLSKGSKIKKVCTVENKESISSTVSSKSSYENCQQGPSLEMFSKKERQRRCSEPVQSKANVKVDVRPKSEELGMNDGVNNNKEKSRMSRGKNKNLCKHAWERNLTST